MRRFAIKTTPQGKSSKLEDFDRCLYGVSVGATNKKIEDILEGYRWARANFQRCCILLGDSLYRFTIQIQRNISSEEAARIAFTSGQKLVEQVFSRLPCIPEIIRCSDILANPRFSEYLHEIQALYEINHTFRESLNNDAQTFVRRQEKKERLAISVSDAVEIATSYLIEEIAVYGCLAEQGWVVDVYLGDELPTLAKIISGEICDVTGPLSQRINVSLRFK